MSSDRNIAGIIVPSAPSATKPMFPPPARANNELDNDSINVALKFNKVTEPIKKVILKDINKLNILKDVSLRVSNKGIF